MRRFLRRTLLVLEVEEAVPFNYDPQYDNAPGGYVKRWRDARWDDLETQQTVRTDPDPPPIPRYPQRPRGPGQSMVPPPAPPGTTPPAKPTR